MTAVHFGFLPEAAHISWDEGACCIEPLPEHSQLVTQMLSHPQVLDGWCYPPVRPINANVQTPLVPQGFALPASHQISLASDDADDEQANFLIALFGMLKGRRLQRPEWQHFYKASIDSKLADFYATDTEIVRALDIATSFWRQHTEPEIRKLAFGALHWHLFAQLYEHEFERFNAQYMALDACYKLATKTRNRFESPSHATRAGALCDLLNMPPPSWAVCLSGQTKCALSERRNALVHEAIYAGLPVGFVHPADQGAMERELTGLVARILLHLLGIDNEYTRSECTTRAMIGFTFN